MFDFLRELFLLDRRVQKNGNFPQNHVLRLTIEKKVTVALGHQEIEHDEGWSVTSSSLEPLLPVTSDHEIHIRADALERPLDQGAQNAVVFDHEKRKRRSTCHKTLNCKQTWRMPTIPPKNHNNPDVSCFR